MCGSSSTPSVAFLALARLAIRDDGSSVDATRAFVFAYAENLERYEACARHVRQELRTLLRGEGLRAIVTSRAKGRDRLEEKLRRRESERGRLYESVEEVAADLHDLVGARVALYYPGTQARVNRLIAERFASVSEPRVFPAGSTRVDRRRTHEGGLFAPRFSGYAAMHHRIRFTPDELPPELANVIPAGLCVEVQVASVLMHAWAEVEHDLVYKPMSGELSLDEYAVLDELNGLVLAGELALERLERAESSRLFTLARPFDDAYELAGFLSSRLRAEGIEPAEGLGRTDVLFALLRRFGKNTPSALLELFVQVRADGSPSRAGLAEGRVADRLASVFVAGHEDREAVLREVSRGSSFADFADDAANLALSTFLERYRAVDRCVGAFLGAIGEWGKRLVVSARGADLLVERGVLTEADARDLAALREVRDRVLHQDPSLDAMAVAAATETIERWLLRLAESTNADIAEIARREVAPESGPTLR